MAMYNFQWALLVYLPSLDTPQPRNPPLRTFASIAPTELLNMRFACWGARWALYWQNSITTGYLAHSFAFFSILQLSPSTSLDALWKPLTNFTRKSLRIAMYRNMYRNVTKSQQLKTDIKRQGSARRKASWLLVESLQWKECWWICGFFHLCGHSANLPERIDELQVISAVPLRKSHETTTERLNFQEESIVHIFMYIHMIFCIIGRNFCLHLPSHSVPVIQHPGSASQFREALHFSQSSHLVYFEQLCESER